MTWRETLSVALAGTGRQQLDERTLLRSAAELSLRRLAGWTPPRGVAPGWEPCDPEQRQLAPTGSLGDLVDGSEEELLQEWLSLAAELRMVVAPSHLAALLELARTRPGLQASLEPVLGERGAWLAAQNPDWDFARVLDPAEAFATGGRPRRVWALKQLRAAAPADARTMLSRGWSAEGGEDRAALLAGLAINLTAADEEFLIAALSDGRKDVRLAARDLLAAIPGSGLASRMRERAHAYLRFKKGLLGGKLEVSPPAGDDPGLGADGIDLKAPQGVGERAWLLTQVISLVPTSEWPPEMTGPVLASEWAKPLWQGLTGAATRFPDARWAEAMLARWAQAKEDSLVMPTEAFRVLEPVAKEAVLKRFLDGDPQLVALLLWETDHRWSADLSTSVARRAHAITGHAGPSLRRIAYSADPAVLPELERTLIGKFSETPGMDSFVERCLDTLRYRAQIRKELTQT